MITAVGRIIALTLLLLSLGVPAADIEARLDRTRVVEGEPVVLTLDLSGDAGQPDLTPLQQDFELINRGHSTRMSFVNGRTSSSNEWHLTLMPRRTGSVEIPALQAGAASSRPLRLEVIPAAQAAQQGVPRPVMLEVESEPKQPYVQQKVLYTVRLLFAEPLRDVQLTEPRITNALIQPLGDEGRSTSYRNGRQYHVIERRYAIQPQHSGTLEIGGPVLIARLPTSQPGSGGLRDRFPGGDPFANLGGVFGQSRPIQVRAPDLKIDVQAQPAGTSSPWLPAESLSLNESWSADPTQFRVGEPVTRTIAITAQGLTAEQLPDVPLDAPPGIKVYKEKPAADTRTDKDTVIAQKVLKAAYVPSQPGIQTLPGIRVAWWDVAAGEEKIARIPAREVEIQAAVAAPTGTPAQGAAAVPVVPAQAADPGEIEGDRQAAAVAAPIPGDPGWWPWIALSLGIALLVIVALWLRERRKSHRHGAQQRPRINPSARPDADPKAALHAIERACQANDAKGARQALLAWAGAQWPDDPPRRLDTLAGRLPAQGAGTLRSLDHALYAEGTGSWTGQAAWTTLKPLLKEIARVRQTNRNSNGLAALYPESGEDRA